ncbi:MAG: PstS family phosphate ABC transporter substrate-binding protein [Planctomycetota bacterium]|jgi:phosphate transport system substrate-binding protein
MGIRHSTFVLGLLLAGAGLAQTDEFPMPARDGYFRLVREVETIDRKSGPEAEKRYKEIRQRIPKAHKAMREEIAALNKRIYGARHEVLLRRARAGVPAGRRLGFTLVDYPLVNGSTSTHPLGMLVACRLLEVDYHWTADYRRPFSRGRPAFDRFEAEDLIVQYRLLAKGEARERARLAAMVNQQLVIHNGTHRGYVHLAERKADLCLLARRPSTTEVNQAAEKGVAYDVRPVALDAFVFIVNRVNPVRGLTTEQLTGIYTDKIRSWKEVGGRDHAIKPYQRDSTSGSQRLMLSVFMRGKPLPERSPRLVRNSMTGPFRALTKDQFGIAYSVFFYEHLMAACPYTRPIAVDGVPPTTETIRARKYPSVTEVYAVMRKDEPEGTNARKLRDWLLTEEGQAVVAESGYVPLPRE